MSYTQDFTTVEYVNLIGQNCCEKAIFECYFRRYMNVNCIIINNLPGSIEVFNCNCL